MSTSRVPRFIVNAFVGSVLTATIVIFAPPAFAHEGREVGPYELTVGWGDEPAYANAKNSVQLVVSKRGAAEDAEEPIVEGVDLDVEVVFGTESTTLAMEPEFVVGAFGEPGDYRAFLLPTRPGTYTFHFIGTIEGREIDEEFTSGPETFSDIEDPAVVSFPTADPNNAQLAERIERDAARTEASLDSATDDASSARTLGFIGIAVGAVALVTSIALGMRRRREPSA